MSLTVDSIVVHGENQVATDVDGEVVVMSIDQGRYFNLNEVGSYIWPLMQEPVSVLELCRQLQDHFAVDTAVCENEVLLFLDKLVERGMVVPAQR